MRFICSIVILLFCNAAWAQQTPLFQTTIHVFDLYGNRDSVVIGFDPQATNDIDPEFGEMELINPFDSVLEVRAGVYYGNPPQLIDKLSKKIINHTIIHPDLNCGGGEFNLYIWSKHQPVVVQWDPMPFRSNSCYFGALVSNHYADELLYPYDWDNWFPQNEYRCLTADSLFVVDVSEEYIQRVNVQPAVSIPWQQVEGLGEKRIYGVRFLIKPPSHGYPCSYITSAYDVENEPTSLILYPNPVQAGTLYIQADSRIISATTFSLDGKILHEIYNESVTELPVHTLKAGIYLVRLVDKNGNHYLRKVVKL